MKLWYHMSGIVSGFLFFPWVSDEFIKFLAVAIPIIVSVTSVVIERWFKLRDKLATEVTQRVKSELEDEMKELKNEVESVKMMIVLTARGGKLLHEAEATEQRPEKTA
ncbi:MAG: hypothetical protein ACKVRP_02365 [Bacteroidota bacterium]